MLLVKLQASDLNTSVIQSATEERIQVSLRSVVVYDQFMASDSPFARVISSSLGDADVFVRLSSVRSLALRGAARQQVRSATLCTPIGTPLKGAPFVHGNHSPHGSTCRHAVDLVMSDLHIIVNQFTIAAVLDFYNGVMDQCFPPTNTTPDVAVSPDRSESPSEVFEDSPIEVGEGMSFKLGATVAHVNVTLVKDRQRLAELVFTSAESTVRYLHHCTITSGTLGSIAITDLTTAGGLYRNFLVSSGENVLTYEYVQQVSSKHTTPPAASGETTPRATPSCSTTNSGGSTHVGPGTSAATVVNEFTMQMASVEVLYTHRFISQLSEYVAHFQEIQQFFHLARQTATDFIAELEAAAVFTKLNVFIDHPVLVLPENSFSNEIFIANLGCMTITNTLENAPPPPSFLVTSGALPIDDANSEINSIKFGVENMHLYSTTRPINERCWATPTLSSNLDDVQPPSTDPVRMSSTASQPAGGAHAAAVGFRGNQRTPEGTTRATSGTTPGTSPGTSASNSSSNDTHGNDSATPTHARHVVHNCSLHVQCDLRLDPRRRDLPATKLDGRVSDVDIALTQHQYGLILNVLNENFGSEAYMDLGLKHPKKDTVLDSPTRQRARSLNGHPDEAMGDLERAVLEQVHHLGSVGAGIAATVGGRVASGAEPGAELVADAVVDDAAPASETTKWVAFDSSVAFKNVRLELFTSDTQRADGTVLFDEPESLARLDLIDSTLSFTSYTDGTDASYISAVTFFSRAIRTHDTQPLCGGVANVFTEVLKPIGEISDAAPPLLQVTYRSSLTAANVYVILNQTRIIVALPWVQRMREWFLTWPQSEVCVCSLYDTMGSSPV